MPLDKVWVPNIARLKYDSRGPAIASPLLALSLSLPLSLSLSPFRFIDLVSKINMFQISRGWTDEGPLTINTVLLNC